MDILITLLEIYYRICQSKNVENRSPFGKVTGRSMVVYTLFDILCRRASIYKFFAALGINSVRMDSTPGRTCSFFHTCRPSFPHLAKKLFDTQVTDKPHQCCPTYWKSCWTSSNLITRAHDFLRFGNLMNIYISRINLRRRGNDSVLRCFAECFQLCVKLKTPMDHPELQRIINNGRPI